MRKTLLVILFLQIFAAGYSQSIIVNGSGAPETNYGAQQLLTDVLLDGGICSTISNFQLKDNPSQQFPSANRSWGYFQKSNSNFPFERGIILTSGIAVNAEGPDDGTQSDGDTGWTGDAEATVLAQFSTYNATVFEFDFVPQGNEISFNYIFASEEYPDFVCQEFNDVFAFIISGPGIVNDPGLDGKNIALLPNGDFVTINNVNDQSCGDDTYYVDGPFADIEHGGRTTPLTAYSEVVPGETYHIRLLIADSFDSQYDSAVFLEAGSFNLGSNITDENGVDLGENFTVCGQQEYTLYVNVDDPTVQLQWFLNDEPIPGATTNQLVATESGTYQIQVTSGDCSATDEVELFFNELQTNNTSFTIQLSDQDGDGVEIFDLTTIESQIIANSDDYTFTYYEELIDAEAGNENNIQTPTAYSASHGDIVYTRVEDAFGCYSVVTVNLRLNQVSNPCDFTPICSNDDINQDVIPLEEEIELNASCVSFTNTEIAFYYLKIEEGTTFTFTIAPDTDNDYDFMLWQNAADCNDLTNIEATRASYDAPFGSYETGLMLDEADLCEGAAPEGGMVDGFVRHLDVQPGDEIIIAIYKFNSGGGFNLSFGGDAILDCTILGELAYEQCDDDQNGEEIFDLNPIAEEIIDGDDFLNVTFYSTEEDATDDTGNNIVSSPYTVTTTSSPDVIYAQVKDDLGGVVEVYTITLSISEGVTGAVNVSDYYCDGGLDGVEIVDLTSYNLIPAQNTYTLTYYETEQDAIDGNANFIPTPNNYTTGTATIYVRIQNASGCFTVAEINIEVSGLQVDLGEDFTICEGQFTLTASGDFSEFTDVTFTWIRNGTVIQGETSSTLNITQIGSYTVTVNTAEGCTGTDTINVLQGESPVITAVNVGPDYVIVEATGGAQPYQYSITGVVWQDSNQFNYLQPGTHTVYVRSAEGCIVSQEFVIFQIPTMFTPNGDGINDTWNIPGFNIYPDSDIVIYDRQGRMVYQSKITTDAIWNGFFMNGQKAPTQDYWYIINVADGRKFTGHVTVKSRGEKN